MSQNEETKIITDMDAYFTEQMEKTGKTREQLEDEFLTYLFQNSNNFLITETVDGVGYAKLEQFGPWGVTTGFTVKGEETQEKAKLLDEYRRLREEFPPVSAGVDYHIQFLWGSGLAPQVDDVKNEHQHKMKEAIELWNRSVYQDDYTIGIEQIGRLLSDEAITVGASACEIVYGDVPIEFSDYVTGEKEVKVGTRDGQPIVETRYVVREPDWRKFKRGITRLKIIDNAIMRLEPVRDTQSFEVLYWVLDKNSDSPQYFHTWQIFWLPWNPKGTRLKGQSQVKKVYVAAKLLEQIMKNVGVNFQRWAEKKYFFICGSDKRPWGKTHIANFLRDIKAMKEKNLTAIPVPAGFDVKSIGGEVFEGQAITQFLLGMIASGMNYPKELILTGKIPDNEKSWLTWMVTQGHNQKMLAHLIEHQLWKKHLYCLFGKTHKIPKQGIPKEKQEEESTFVPRLVWQSEGRWARETKIKTLKLIGDMANPVSDVLHVAIQKDLAKTLGYGELDWDDTEKYLEVQKENKIIKAQLEKIELEAKLKYLESLSLEERVDTVRAIYEAKKQAAEQDEASQEEKLRGQTERRLAGGVSRTTQPSQTGRGKARSLGEGPRKVEETIEKRKAVVLDEVERLIEELKDKK